MLNNHFSNPVSEKERWWAALSYFFSPILPAVLFFIFDLDEMPFLKQHIVQAILVGVLLWLIMPVLLVSTFCIGGLLWLVLPYWSLQAYHGQTITIPWISAWVKSQGWE